MELLKKIKADIKNAGRSVEIIMIILLVIILALTVFIAVGAYNDSKKDLGDGEKQQEQLVELNDSMIVSEDLCNELKNTDDGVAIGNESVKANAKLIEISNFIVGNMQNSSIIAVENAYNLQADEEELQKHKETIGLQLETLRGYDKFMQNNQFVQDDVKQAWNDFYDVTQKLYDSIGEEKLGYYNEFSNAASNLTGILISKAVN